jgi:hypothetical protein
VLNCGVADWGAPVFIGRNPTSLNAPAMVSATDAWKPDMTSGVAIGDIIVPTTPAVGRPAPGPRSCTSSGRSANGCAQAKAALRAARRPSRVTGTCSFACLTAGRWAGSAATSRISAMGVMPAMGSLEN